MNRSTKLLIVIFKALYSNSHNWNQRFFISKATKISQRNTLENKATKPQCNKAQGLHPPETSPDLTENAG